MTSPRSALLVSGSIGMGHDVLAAACAAVLRAQGWSTATVDAMRMLGRGGVAGEATFRVMLGAPGLYDAVHFSALRTGNKIALTASALARRKLVPRLRDYLEQHPIDLVISAFATGAAAVSTLALEFPAMAHVVFCTDATPHRLWVQRDVDMYLVTSGVAELAVLRFEPAAEPVTRSWPPSRPVSPGCTRSDSRTG
jgi:processive 1,2-diacylglycerol beta-glucosyltransferase